MVSRAVLDTSVVVAALRTRLGAGNAVLRLVANRRLVLLATPPLFLEYEDVLKRPEQRLAHGLGPEEIDKFLAELAALIDPVEVHFQWRPQVRDPSDEMVLEAAINGGGGCPGHLQCAGLCLGWRAVRRRNPQPSRTVERR